MPKKTIKSPNRGGGKKKVKILDGDPPIIIGGGGSTYVWLNKSLNPQFFDPTLLGQPNQPPAPAPNTAPKTPSSYYLLVLGNFDISSVDFDNGQGGGGGKQKVLDQKKTNTRFE